MGAMRQSRHDLRHTERARAGAAFGPPTERRGILPLLVAMGALKVGQGIAGAIEGNQRSQRNKGYINQAYRVAQQRMGQQQAVGREDLGESLTARGLQVSPIASAMMSTQAAKAADYPTADQLAKLPVGQRRAIQGQMQRDGVTPAAMAAATAKGPAPTSLGGQAQADLEREYGLDRTALDAAHVAALNQNKADLLNTYINSGATAAQGVMSAYGNQQAYDAAQAGTEPWSEQPITPSGPLPDVSLTPNGELTAPRGSIAAAMLSSASYGGIHPTDPLGEASSAWKTPTGGVTRIGDGGQQNFDFNTGGY